MPVNGQEVVYEGWLTKSPPTKRIWKARWRRRWFSLRHSGELPGQFRLTYYTDRNCRKLKGVIDLDHCEQVDLGLKHEERKLKFDHVFDIKTPTRTYYLAADSENEMKSWVNCICKVCGLKSTSDEEEGSNVDRGEKEEIMFCEEDLMSGESPPVSPVSTSPYIPISECITGRSPIIEPRDFKALLQCNLKNSFSHSNLPQNHLNENIELPQRTYLNFVSSDSADPRFYDCPRQLAPYTNKDVGCVKNQEVAANKDESSRNASPLQSPTDSESVFTDDDWVLNTSSDLDLRKSARPSDSSADLDMIVVQKFTKLSMNDQKNHNSTVLAPPRPPKPYKGPSYLNISPSHLNNKSSKDVSDNENLSAEMKLASDEQRMPSDEMYDFPRSHVVDVMEQSQNLPRRHCYNNAAPFVVENQIFRYDNISPKPGTSTTMFRYDSEDAQDDPSSPLSQRSSTAVHSNLPSPCFSDLHLTSPPPVVNRGLKPKCRLTDSASLLQSHDSLTSAPCVDRKLKPTQIQLSEYEDYSTSNYKIRTEVSIENLYQNNETEEIYHYLPTNKNMQYLDLDLEGSSNIQFSDNGTSVPIRSSAPNTVYKKVDFMKTEAFNITRNNLEKERKETVTYIKK